MSSDINDITTFNTWKYIVPLTIIVLVIGLILTFFNNNKAVIFGNLMLLIGIILFIYCLYLFSLK